MTAARPGPANVTPLPAAGWRRWRRWWPIAVLGLGMALVLALGLHRYLSLEALRQHQAELAAFVAHRRPLAMLAYVLTYATGTALSLPCGLVLTVAGGLLFGGLLGGLLALAAALTGATIAFLATRATLGHAVAGRQSRWVHRLRRGFQEQAFGYLLVLRLIPLVPFAVVNVVPALLGVSPRTYLLASLLGMVPATMIYAHLGYGLGMALARGEGGSAALPVELVLGLVGLALLAALPLGWRLLRKRRAATDPLV